METAKSNINFDELRKEFISITTSSKTLETMYNKSRLVDLDKVGVMLAETRERINTLRRRKGFVGSVCSKLPLISKITKVTTIEANLQKSINDYTTEMADVFDKKYDETYQIEALPKAFTDFFGNTNDTLKVKVHTPKEEDLATLKLNLNLSDGVQYPIILQLTNEKATEVIQELYISKAQAPYILKNIQPAKYRLRIIEDRNGNRKWDTGSFLQQLQPERVWYLSATLELRANWEVEETWEVKE